MRRRTKAAFLAVITAGAFVGGPTMYRAGAEFFQDNVQEQVYIVYMEQSRAEELEPILEEILIVADVVLDQPPGFSERLIDINERYGISQLDWWDEHGKTQEWTEEILGFYSPEEQSDVVTFYLDSYGSNSELISRSLENLIDAEEWEFCLSPLALDITLNAERPLGLYATCTSSFSWESSYEWQDDGSLRVTGRTGEEMQEMFRGAIDEQAEVQSIQRENVQEWEDATEVILSSQLQDWFEANTSQFLDIQVELEDISYNGVHVRDISSGQGVTTIIYQGPLPLELREELDALIQEYPQYAFSEIDVAGVSYNPVLVEVGDLVTTTQIAAHEFAHHLFENYPVREIPGEAGNVINETLSEIYGWAATRDILTDNYLIAENVVLSPLLDAHVAQDGTILPLERHISTNNHVQDSYSLRYGGE